MEQVIVRRQMDCIATLQSTNVPKIVGVKTKTAKFQIQMLVIVEAAIVLNQQDFIVNFPLVNAPRMCTKGCRNSVPFNPRPVAMANGVKWQRWQGPRTHSTASMWDPELIRPPSTWTTTATWTWWSGISTATFSSTHAPAAHPPRAAVGVANVFTQQHPPRACATPTRPAHIAPRALQENWNSFTKVVKVFMVPSHRRAFLAQQENGATR